ncbi:MAG: DUF3805 domain-containing protein [Bacteroides sp.]
MKQGKKFISPDSWFSMIYPSNWNEFEDSEGTFLFYNPDTWTGNFRISAYKEEPDGPCGMDYAHEVIQQELNDNSSALHTQVGNMECAYSKEMFEEKGVYYTNHTWITGAGNVAFECSFTVVKGGEVKEAVAVISSLVIRNDEQKYPAELIPIRVSEVYLVDERYEWMVNLVKTELKKDFTGTEEDLPKLQEIVDSGILGAKKKDEWLAVGMALCVILANEVADLEWMTLIDGNREAPVLVYKETGKQVDPLRLVWSKVKTGEPCLVEEAYQNALV